MTLLNIGGLTNTMGNIGGMFFDGTDFFNSSFIKLLLFTLGGTLIGGTISGFFGRSISESYFLTPISTTLLALYLVDFYSVLQVVQSTGHIWLYWITFIIMGGLAAGYSIALVQFWRGNDI
jgi:hypothetical protein